MRKTTKAPKPEELAAVTEAEAPANGNAKHTCAECTKRDQLIQQQHNQIEFMRTKLNAIVMILQSQ